MVTSINKENIKVRQDVSAAHLNNASSCLQHNTRHPGTNLPFFVAVDSLIMSILYKEKNCRLRSMVSHHFHKYALLSVYSGFKDWLGVYKNCIYLFFGLFAFV